MHACDLDNMYFLAPGGNVVICSIGTHTRHYCASACRTFLLHPTPTQKRVSDILFRAHAVAVGELKV
jgi:Xaa-Pro aminopeptidase